MIFSLKQLALILFFIISFSTLFAQGVFSNELGIIVGPVVHQSDFGERHDFESTAGNTGIGFGIIHFMNFEYRAGYAAYSYFNDHFKIRSELSFNKTKLKHFGKWVDSSRTDETAEKLRAHTGESNNIDVGMQLEFFPFSLKEFSYSRYAFSPFISLGAHLTSYNPRAYTTYGNGNSNNLDNFYTPWYLYPDGTVRDTKFLIQERGFALSIVGSVGTRYKLARLSDIMLDLRAQYFFSDKIDGLDHKLPSNKFNDYLIWLNVGYVHYFN